MFNISQNFIKNVLWICWGVVAINYIHYFNIVFICPCPIYFWILLFSFSFTTARQNRHRCVFLKSNFNSLSFNRLAVLLLFKQTFHSVGIDNFKTSRIDEWQTKEMENKILALWSISVMTIISVDFIKKNHSCAKINLKCCKNWLQYFQVIIIMH